MRIISVELNRVYDEYGESKFKIDRKKRKELDTGIKRAEKYRDKGSKSCIIGIASPSPTGNGTVEYSVRTQAVVRDWRVGAEYRTQDMW